MTRIYDRTSFQTLDALALLEAGGLQVTPVNADLGIDAGELHARFYDRHRSPLSMADCVALATARSLSDSLATSDPPLAAAARSVGVAIVALPDREGRRPTA